MSPQTPIQETPRFAQSAPDVGELPSVVIVGHSPLFYWWPVWLYGFVCAVFTYVMGDTQKVGEGELHYFTSSAAIGVSFTILLLMVILFTTSSMKGVHSVLAILGLSLFVTIAGWSGVLDDLLGLFPELHIHMNMGFYLFFSTCLFIVWCLSFFVFDRFRFWRVRPGQMTEERLIGDALQSYDTRGMLFEKDAEDYFRHLLLGFGTGDVRLNTSGAKSESIVIQNVLFADSKVKKIQKLIAVEPDQLIDA